MFFESIGADPLGLALRSKGCSPGVSPAGESSFDGVTEGLAERSGVVVGEICC
jgi:hypothetical protein